MPKFAAALLDEAHESHFEPVLDVLKSSFRLLHQQLGE